MTSAAYLCNSAAPTIGRPIEAADRRLSNERKIEKNALVRVYNEASPPTPLPLLMSEDIYVDALKCIAIQRGLTASLFGLRLFPPHVLCRSHRLTRLQCEFCELGVFLRTGVEHVICKPRDGLDVFRIIAMHGLGTVPCELYVLYEFVNMCDTGCRNLTDSVPIHHEIIVSCVLCAAVVDCGMLYAVMY